MNEEYLAFLSFLYTYIYYFFFDKFCSHHLLLYPMVGLKSAFCLPEIEPIVGSHNLVKNYLILRGLSDSKSQIF